MIRNLWRAIVLAAGLVFIALFGCAGEPDQAQETFRCPTLRPHETRSNEWHTDPVAFEISEPAICATDQDPASDWIVVGLFTGDLGDQPIAVQGGTNPACLDSRVLDIVPDQRYTIRVYTRTWWAEPILDLYLGYEHCQTP